jgi:spore maturation protein CgeB
VARSGDEMKEHLSALLADPGGARALADHGRATILARHTCAHRVAELLAIARELDAREAA